MVQAIKVICSNELNLFHRGEMFQRKMKLEESVALHRGEMFQRKMVQAIKQPMVQAIKVICSNELNLFHRGEMFQRKMKLEESVALHLLSIVQQYCRPILKWVKENYELCPTPNYRLYFRYYYISKK
jgi:hypothetical protein